MQMLEKSDVIPIPTVSITFALKNRPDLRVQAMKFMQFCAYYLCPGKRAEQHSMF